MDDDGKQAGAMLLSMLQRRLQQQGMSDEVVKQQQQQQQHCSLLPANFPHQGPSPLNNSASHASRAATAQPAVDQPWQQLQQQAQVEQQHCHHLPFPHCMAGYADTLPEQQQQQQQDLAGWGIRACSHIQSYPHGGGVQPGLPVPALFEGQPGLAAAAAGSAAALQSSTQPQHNHSSSSSSSNQQPTGLSSLFGLQGPLAGLLQQQQHPHSSTVQQQQQALPSLPQPQPHVPSSLLSSTTTPLHPQLRTHIHSPSPTAPSS